MLSAAQRPLVHYLHVTKGVSQGSGLGPALITAGVGQDITDSPLHFCANIPGSVFECLQSALDIFRSHQKVGAGYSTTTQDTRVEFLVLPKLTCSSLLSPMLKII